MPHARRPGAGDGDNVISVFSFSVRQNLYLKTATSEKRRQCLGILAGAANVRRIDAVRNQNSRQIRSSARRLEYPGIRTGNTFPIVGFVDKPSRLSRDIPP